jgi:hypothetical protein
VLPLRVGAPVIKRGLLAILGGAGVALLTACLFWLVSQYVL